MLFTLSDPGLRPIVKQVTTFDEIMELLTQYNTSYVTAFVSNDNHIVIMTARRKLGEIAWTIKYYSSVPK